MTLTSNMVSADLNKDNFQWNCAMEFTAFTMIYGTIFVVASLIFVWSNLQS